MRITASTVDILEKAYVCSATRTKPHDQTHLLYCVAEQTIFLANWSSGACRDVQLELDNVRYRGLPDEEYLAQLLERPYRLKLSGTSGCFYGP